MTAELLGCDAVGCPMAPYQDAQCKVGNATLQVIGIANVTTTVDTRPLTWTVGQQEAESGRNGAQITYDRNFYLGTPPSLQLKNTTGCALFFEGIAASLTPPDRFGNFSCSDLLNKDCISDLITQAQTAVNPGEAANDSDFCNKLREALGNKRPSTCNGVQGSWETMVARPLTGDQALQKMDQSQCRPTTGDNYDLFLVHSQRQHPSSRELKELAAVTPVMTVFREADDTNAELSCLGFVETKAGLVAQGSSAGINAPFLGYLGLLAFTFVFVV
ncbi:uncharacterized protein EI97DRAFT_460263 [Westerdykella ornata]|uniref:Uncharacterized protein n=1 Tax=Westerdykella ornata TaxID=318751 RepID=A0A6A6JGR5_WESOR|nr:uncharacterized protein EI97DRAFT_460263 [Westerdykella ornata]KAF2274409.1 hypothetical protein EI97DRAFT_460263 [Westerdykella ornata]